MTKKKSTNSKTAKSTKSLKSKSLKSLKKVEKVEKTYIEWDFDRMQAIRYKRIGECNRCGECCQGFISFLVAFTDKEKSKDRDRRDGGDTTTDEGVWSEVERGKERLFFGMKERRKNGNNCCRLTGRDTTMQEIINTVLEDAGCSMYEKRPKICSEWPLSPADIAVFTSCSYSFEEIERWKIEDLVDLKD